MQKFGNDYGYFCEEAAKLYEFVEEKKSKGIFVVDGTIAIILINYNGYVDTVECLESIAQSLYPSIEIYITDNNSSDNSVMKIKEYIKDSKLKIHLIQSKKNDGFSAGNNLAVKNALKNKNIKYFLFLNNDTIITPTCISNLIMPLDFADASIGKIMYESNRDIIWYGGGSIDCKTLKPVHFGFDKKSEKYNKPSFVNFASGCCLCLTRRCINEIGLWNESYFLYEEDVDFSIRIINAGMKIYYNPEAILFHKVGASTSQVSGLSQFYQVRNRFLLVKKNLEPHKRFYAYFYNLLMFINRVRKKEYRVAPLVQGIKAAIKGEEGKHEGLVN